MTCDPDYTPTFRYEWELERKKMDEKEREEVGAPQFMREEPCVQCGSADFEVKLAPPLVVADLQFRLSAEARATIDWDHAALRTCRKCGTHGVALRVKQKESPDAPR